MRFRSLPPCGQELQEMKQSPLKAALQRSVQTLEAKVSQLRVQIDALKEIIIEGCKQALADFKQRGTAALDGVARFFHLREGLEGDKGNHSGGDCHRRKGPCENRSRFSRIPRGGQAFEICRPGPDGEGGRIKAKGPGKLAKTVAAPYRAERSSLLSMQKSVEKALARIERLEQAAEKKPSILDTMRTQNEKIRAEPAKEAPPSKYAER